MTAEPEWVGYWRAVADATRDVLPEFTHGELLRLMDSTEAINDVRADLIMILVVEEMTRRGDTSVPAMDAAITSRLRSQTTAALNVEMQLMHRALQVLGKSDYATKAIERISGILRDRGLSA